MICYYVFNITCNRLIIWTIKTEVHGENPVSPCVYITSRLTLYNYMRLRYRLIISLALGFPLRVTV